MNFYKNNAYIHIPDGSDQEKALAKTTHLAIGAHPDDIEIMAYHGIAECFGKDDKWFSGVTVTDGAGSPRSGVYADCTDEEMQKIRQQEQRKAADVGEYSCVIQLMYSSAETKDPGNRNTVSDIQSILERAKPETVYLHNPADKHDTHVSTIIRAVDAMRAMPADVRPCKVYGCEVWRDLDWLPDEDKQGMDVSMYPNLAEALVGVFDSQISGGKRYDLATAGRRRANATYSAADGVDESKALIFAMDLAPLLAEDSLSIADYTAQFIEKFKQDVEERLIKLTN